MLNRVLVGIILIALVASLGILLERVEIERANRRVELIIDYDQWQQLAADRGVDTGELLTALRERGVSMAAVSPDSIGQYLLAGRELPHAVAAYLDTLPAIQQVERLAEPAGFDLIDFQPIHSAGLGLVLRPYNSPWDQGPMWDEIVAQQPKMLVFYGNQVAGYPDNLDVTRKMVAELGVIVGSVEFSGQQGLSAVVNADRLIRVHSITPGEMNKLPVERLISRNLRAVRERNIRALYLRPIEEGAEPIERSLAYVQLLSDELSRAGFPVGKAQPFEAWPVDRRVQAVVWLGSLAAGLLLFLAVWPIPAWAAALLLLTGWAGVWVLGLRSLLLVQQALALLTALVFPVGAVVISRRYAGRPLAGFLAASLISLVGAVLVAGLLAGDEFLVKLAEFRGVKAAHVLPIVLLLAYGLISDLLPLRSWPALAQRCRQILTTRIPLYLVATGALVGLLSLIYVGRTGNYSILVSDLEIALREGAERLLLVRPRTKEVFIGHPALFLSLFPQFRRYWLGLAGLAVIGQLSMINTFSHIHTPLLLSVLRTIYGLGFGLVVGLVVYWLISVGRRVAGLDSNFRVFRIRQLGR